MEWRILPAQGNGLSAVPAVGETLWGADPEGRGRRWVLGRVICSTELGPGHLVGIGAIRDMNEMHHDYLIGNAEW